ncbi:MAG: methyltransferase domain-containing protein, partial [Anaerolineales bacterium]
MNRDPQELFDERYFATGCGRPYRRDEEWLSFFAGIAQKIAIDIQPDTVLDAGCAMGFLVEGLRNLGVDAFGVDISKFAIDHIHSTIKEFCWQGSIGDPFPQHYDLITCVEVLEHIP